eukprot:Skav235414  [mRNA]  locus=scaffold924:73815:75290:+ [translate_table: standard]
MHKAAQRGHAEVLAALATAGADVEAEDGVRREPRELRRLRDRRRRAAAEGRGRRTDPGAGLLRLGAPVTPKDIGGNTPLHWAAREGHVAVAKLLVEAGAPLESRTDDGRGPRWEELGWVRCQTPLDISKQEGKTDVVKLLEAKLRGFQRVQWAAAPSVQVLQVITVDLLSNDLLTAVLACSCHFCFA